MNFVIYEYPDIEFHYKVSNKMVEHITMSLATKNTYPQFNHNNGFSLDVEKHRIFDHSLEQYRQLGMVFTNPYLFLIDFNIKNNNFKSNVQKLNNIKLNEAEKNLVCTTIIKHPIAIKKYRTKISDDKSLRDFISGSQPKHNYIYLSTSFFRQKYIHFSNEEYNQTLMLSNCIMKILDNLDNDTTLCICFFSFTLDSTVQLIWLITLLFDSIIVLRKHFYSEFMLGTARKRCIEFVKFDKKKYASMRPIFVELMVKVQDLSSEMPRGTYLEDIYPPRTFDKLPDTQNSVFLHNILSSPIDPAFTETLKKVQIKVNEINLHATQNLKKFIEWYRSGDFNIKELMLIKHELMVIAKNYCFSNNIEIKEKYMDKNLDSLLKNKGKIDIIKSYFPPHPKIREVKLSIEALYSVSHYKHNELVVKYLEKKIDVSKFTMIDMTANVGGVTIYMAHHFKSVIAIEYDSMNYNSLVKNINLYGLKNVKHIKDNSLDVVSKMLYKKKTNNIVVFLDPPWGGVDYKSQKTIELYLDNININDIVEFIVYLADFIILKAPLNFNHKNQHLKHHKIKFKNYQLLIYSGKNRYQYRSIG